MGKPIADLFSVTTVGLDLAKHVFRVHCVDSSGRVIVAKSLRRNNVLGFFAQLPKCLVGLEACGSAHYWAREDRIYTVMSGVFYIGLGEQFDGDKVMAYPPGSVIVLPGDTWHFHWAKSGEYVHENPMKSYVCFAAAGHMASCSLKNN